MRNYTAAVPSFQLPPAGELILGAEQGLLCLPHRKQVGRPLPVLQLGYPERLLRCHDQLAQAIFRPAGIGDLGPGELHIGVGVERGWISLVRFFCPLSLMLSCSTRR